MSVIFPTLTNDDEGTLVSRYEVPIINFDCLNSNTPKGIHTKQVSTKLVRALAKKGFAILVNHGVSLRKTKDMYQALDDFCGLPQQSRAKCECVAPSHSGYIKTEEGPSLRETESRHEFIVSGKDTVLPDEDLPTFRNSVDSLVDDFKVLTTRLLVAIAVGLGQPSDYFLKNHTNLLNSGNDSSFRMICYSPTYSVKGGEMRFGPSSETGTFSFFISDCESGFEVKSIYSERWSRVGYFPGGILVCAGDALARWTNQQMVSLKHRVVVPEHCPRSRHTFGFCVEPDENVEFEALDTSILNPPQEPVLCRLQKKKRGVLSAYHHLQRRFREAYAS
ncbi:LOW QUALITY PROTEIN: uncharacterized protein LOC141531588 [Cotesia typhae]|uniref:LOW QUALITY PROTEIN: uncharacterized protein LOC141531588 n=1 Tax=Cotesia typhae TaxID=2053667 RepID=UPI003D695A48